MAALVFTALEVRSRKKEQQFSNYLAGIGGFIDDTRLLVENKDLQRSSEFRWTLQWVTGDYTPEFIAEVNREVEEAQK